MKNFEELAQQLKLRLDKANRILIISHVSPDGDTIGSGTALRRYLEKQGKEVTNFCKDKVPASLEFIPESWTYTTDPEIFKTSYDTVIIVDNGGHLDRAGVETLLPSLPNKAYVINIDHHASNPNYGDLNIVDPEISSTCELTYLLFKELNFKLDDLTSTCLLSGVVTDTGALTNPATKQETVQVASELIQTGANLQQVLQKTMRNKQVDELKLWGRALARLQKNSRYDIASTYIKRSDLDEVGVTDEAMEGLANYLAVLKEARIILVLKEADDGLLKGSMRTPFEHDLSALALKIGGGGHKKAAGFTIRGSIVETDQGWHIA